MFEQSATAENVFLQDVQGLRQDSRNATLARPHATPQLTIDLLQNLLAAEIICVMRYSLLALSEDGLKNDRLATEFLAQASDERRHMVMLARRIEALGGVPDFRPAGLTGRVAALSREGSFAARLQQNLAAEQCVVAHYRELVAYFEGIDPETASLLQDILQDEEDHTGDMQDLLVSTTS